ncbi:response regulator transcription factor [Burkholderia sp. Ax-1719]|uniref:response regulator transcription factor n=1 Tax=Burkholderia sp. Ax-1719 TaxID=2608334 RepID=UPI00141DE58D|nr:response regulator transcription factor [Burkholderia sp. Ax-1719]NIE62428.1 response regulator transcription factor [Burkholderia sp. Ax-1719]
MDNNESQSSWLQAATRHEADTIGDRSVISIGLFDCSGQHGVLYDVLTHAEYLCIEIRTIDELATMLRRGALDMLIVAGFARDSRSIEALNLVRTDIVPDVPLLIVGEPDNADAESLALNAGADDYLVESRSPEVLIARVASLLRRVRRRQAATLERYGDYEFDTSRGIVTLRGSTVTLTQREFDLARLLFRHLNAPLSRAQIFESVWRQSFGVTSRTVDTHICWLRSKLQLHPVNGYVVTSVHGYGYRLEAVRETR